MATKKKIYLTRVGDVHVQKKKHMRTLRLRVDHEGRVILSIPRWSMLKQAIDFAGSKTDWILAEKSKNMTALRDGCMFGNGIKLSISATQKSRPGSDFSHGVLSVKIPIGYSPHKTDAYVKRKADEAVRSQAEQVILPRLKQLAYEHGFIYRSASIIYLRSRWGSCDHKGNIKFSAYLVQLPGHLIDYVILHELNHTKNMDHSRKFWQDLRAVSTDIKTARKELKEHSPRLKTYMA